MYMSKNQFGFIDIHSHILPGIDDGSLNYYESLKLISSAIKDGIRYIVLTPHYMHHGRYRVAKEDLLAHYHHFKETIMSAGLDITLFLGNELYIHDELDEIILNDYVCTMNNTSYVLIEFPFGTYNDKYDRILRSISLNGYRIIIAHPERYAYVRKDIDFCQRWLKKGYYLQINQDSLFNNLEKTAMKLIDKGYVSFVASDAHNENRPCALSKAYDKICEKFSNKVANELFCENAIKILKDEYI